MKKMRLLPILLAIAAVLFLCPLTLEDTGTNDKRLQWVTDAFGENAVSVSEDKRIGKVTLALSGEVELADTLSVPPGMDLTIQLDGCTLTGPAGKSAIEMAAPDFSADDSAITLTITGSEGSQILGGAGTGGNGGCAVELANGCSGVLSISGAVALVGGDASSGGTAKGGDAIGSRGVSGVVDVILRDDSVLTLQGGSGSEGGYGIFASGGDVTVGAGCRIAGGSGHGGSTGYGHGISGVGIHAMGGSVTVGDGTIITGGTGKGVEGGDGIITSGGSVKVGVGCGITGGDGSIGGTGIYTNDGEVTVGDKTAIRGGTGTGEGGYGIFTHRGAVEVGAGCEIIGGDGVSGMGGGGVSTTSGSVTVGDEAAIKGGGDSMGGCGISTCGNVTVGDRATIEGGISSSGTGGAGIYAAGDSVTVGDSTAAIGGAGNSVGRGILRKENGAEAVVPITDGRTGAVLTPVTAFFLEIRNGGVAVPPNGVVTVETGENDPVITITAPETGGTVIFGGSDGKLTVTGGMRVQVGDGDPVTVPASGSVNGIAGTADLP